MPPLDAIVFLTWKVPASGTRSLGEGWFKEYVKACGWLALHLPWMVARRQPVSREVMRRWYYLRTHRADDYRKIEASRMNAWDYYWLKWRSRSLRDTSRVGR